MKQIDHPNIVKLVEVIDDPQSDLFFMGLFLFHLFLPLSLVVSKRSLGCRVWLVSDVWRCKVGTSAAYTLFSLSLQIRVELLSYFEMLTCSDFIYVLSCSLVGMLRCLSVGQLFLTSTLLFCFLWGSAGVCGRRLDF